MKILGISALYHDAAAALIEDSEIVAAAQEERFTRKKHDPGLPFNAIDHCLEEGGVRFSELDGVVYYDQPLLTLDRYIENVLALGKGSDYMVNRLEEIVCSRLTVDRKLRDRYGVLGKEDRLYTLEHHISHAASAFYPSPFDSAAILTIDGVGEWATTTISRGSGEHIEMMQEIDYPHSLGLLYSAFTTFCGFKANSGDYKFMGLAPYGEPIYEDVIKKEIIDIKPDGSFRLNLDLFDYYRGKYMTNDKFAALFNGPRREPESKIGRREMDIAASAQKVTEEIVEKLAAHACSITGESKLVMAGGVALNCVANGKLLRSGIIDDIWIQPAAGDAGGALGAALYMYHEHFGGKRPAGRTADSQKGSYLGPSYSDDVIEAFLKENDYPYIKAADEEDLCERIAGDLDNGSVVGWFQGRMEYGPRALGNRSILGDPRSEKMQSLLNLKIKYRESFRPFAPSVLRERVSDYFETEHDSPYMLIVSDVCASRREPFDKKLFLEQYDDNMLPIVNARRSDIPAVTHIDYSARVQTVTEDTNRPYYRLLKKFEEKTGCGVLINTSFNVRGEPIVRSPKEAYLCFMRTEMDVLVLGNCILLKGEQPAFDDSTDWRKEYELD